MRLTFRSKLIVLVAVNACALLALVLASSLISERVDRQLSSIQRHYVPRIGLKPQLESSFERVGRAFQDAVATADEDLFAEARQHVDTLLEQVRQAGAVMPAADADRLRAAIEDYGAAAADVSRRLVDGETGETMVAKIEAMQEKIRVVGASPLTDD